jgi:hypothetical protein
MLILTICVNLDFSGLLQELVTIAGSLREGEGQLGRAKYKLSALYAEKEMQSDSDSCRAQALEIRDRLHPEMKDSAFAEASFMKLCPWMLW